jgi:hypothetical protein
MCSYRGKDIILLFKWTAKYQNYKDLKSHERLQMRFNFTRSLDSVFCIPLIGMYGWAGHVGIFNFWSLHMKPFWTLISS